MKRIRFTIASLLIVVLLVAIGFAALRESSDLWESGCFTLTLAALLTSILLGRPPNRVQAGFLDRIRPVRLDLPGSVCGAVDRTQADDEEGVGLP